MNTKEIREALPAFVSPKRLQHILAVELEVIQMAEMYRIGTEQVEELRKAALLHDVTHEKSLEEQRAICALYGYPLSEDDLLCPQVLHQFTGALIAADYFGLGEREAAAIACHTTGKPQMTIIEKILCLADFIEPTRPYASCKELREEFYTGYREETCRQFLDTCMSKYLENTIFHLQEKSSVVHPLTLAALAFYKNQCTDCPDS